MTAKDFSLLKHPLNQSSLIEASAGTGKTYSIEHLYLRYLLETDYGVRQLLVVTFTNAATQELKQRIRNKIAEALEYAEHPETEHELIKQLLAENRNNEHLLIKLRQALVTFDQASIFSINGFCQQILNRFPIETDSLSDRNLLKDEKILKQQVIRDYWRHRIIHLDQQDWLRFERNWKSIETFSQQLEIVIAHYPQNPIDEQDLQSLDDSLNDCWKTLTHSWQKHHLHIQSFLLDAANLKQNSYKPATVAKLIDQVSTLFDKPVIDALPEKIELLGYTKINSSLKKGIVVKENEENFFQQMQTFIKLFADHEKAWAVNFLLQAANWVRQKLQFKKDQSGSVSFSDQITRVSEAIKKSAGGLTEAIAHLNPVAMVDEFQDTDAYQYHIFSSIYQKRGELILIGDPKQSIYRFRGADIFSYGKARRETLNRYRLDINHRSSESMITVVNRFFEKNPQAFVFEKLIEWYPSHPGRSAHITCTDKDGALPPLSVCLKPWTDKPVAQTEATEYFAAHCATEIASLLIDSDVRLDGEPIKAGDIAILVKTGNQANKIKQALAEFGISSALQLRESVFHSEQAVDLLCLLQSLENPRQGALLNAALSSDLFAWTAGDLLDLQQTPQLQNRLIEQFHEYRQLLLEKGFLALYYRLVEQQQLVEKTLRYRDGERRMTNWRQLFELLQQQFVEKTTLSAVLLWLQQQMQLTDGNSGDEHQLRLESDRDLVQIVTVHRSKGLQYPVVFLPFMWSVSSVQNRSSVYTVHNQQGEKELLIQDESHRPQWLRENLAEDVRLLYVAMTRARYHVYLGWGNIQRAEYSALGWCLYPEKYADAGNIRALNLIEAESLKQPFKALDTEQRLVRFISQKETVSTLQSTASTASVAAPLSMQRRVKNDWQVSSYSQLARQRSQSDPEAGLQDHDAEDNLSAAIIQSNSPSELGLDRYSFYKGSRAGTFLHELLEHMDFSQQLDKQQIIAACQHYGFSDSWNEVITQWLEDIRETDLQGFTLSQLSADKRINEMEFYLSLNNLRLEPLSDYLFQQGYQAKGRQWLQQKLNGYLSGFIDLIFEHDKKFYVADYKSNHLGEQLQDYEPQACHKAMLQHDYYLQALIYCVAVKRYLQQRLQDFDFETGFGGVYYLFLRGMYASNKHSQGVLFFKPSTQQILEFEQLLD